MRQDCPIPPEGSQSTPAGSKGLSMDRPLYLCSSSPCQYRCVSHLTASWSQSVQVLATLPCAQGCMRSRRAFVSIPCTDAWKGTRKHRSTTAVPLNQGPCWYEGKAVGNCVVTRG